MHVYMCLYVFTSYIDITVSTYDLHTYICLCSLPCTLQAQRAGEESGGDGRGGAGKFGQCGGTAHPPSSSARLLSSLEFSDTTIYEPEIRALLETAPHFCWALVLKFRTLLPNPCLLTPKSRTPSPKPNLPTPLRGTAGNVVVLPETLSPKHRTLNGEPWPLNTEH